MDDDRDMSKAAAATTQSVPTTTVRGARDDCRFATRVRLVPDAEGFDVLVRSRRPDDFTRSTNVRNVGRRAVRILLPLFEGTTIPSSINVFAIGPFRSKRTAARRRERCLETTENIGCRYVQFESLANDAKRNTQFRHLNHEEREARRNAGSFRERRGECAPTAAAALARRAGRAAPHS
jgi:hypothetical protein